MLNLLLLRKSHWKRPNKDTKFVNSSRKKSCAAAEVKEAENGEDSANNPNMLHGSALTVDDCVPESGDHFKATSESTIAYDFVEKVLNHLGRLSHLPAFFKHEVCDHVVLSSSCEDLSSKLKPLRLGDQVIKEITVFMAGFHSAFSSDADKEMFSKLSTVLTNKSGKSQSTEQQNLVIGSYCNLVEPCEPTGPQPRECVISSDIRRPVLFRQHLSDPSTMTSNDVKNCESHNSYCFLHQSHSSSKFYNRWDSQSQAPDTPLSNNCTPSSNCAIKKDVEPSVSVKYREKNSVSEIDVSFLQKVTKQLEEHDRWKEFMSKCKSVQRFRSGF